MRHPCRSGRLTEARPETCAPSQVPGAVVQVSVTVWSLSSGAHPGHRSGALPWRSGVPRGRRKPCSGVTAMLFRCFQVSPSWGFIIIKKGSAHLNGYLNAPGSLASRVSDVQNFSTISVPTRTWSADCRILVRATYASIPPHTHTNITSALMKR